MSSIIGSDTAGDTITFEVVVLSPTYPKATDPGIVAVPWGHYRSLITGGTGKLNNSVHSWTA
jgi:hypothetical protein